MKMYLLAIVSLIGISLALPACADLPPGTDLSFGIFADTDADDVIYGGPNNNIIQVLNKDGFPGAFFEHWQTTGNCGVRPLIGAPDVLSYRIQIFLQNFDESSGVANYTGTFWAFVPSVGDTFEEYIEKATLDMNFNYNAGTDFRTATIDGSWIFEVGPRQPPGIGEPVDWSGVNPGFVWSGTWNKFPSPGQPELYIHVHGVCQDDAVIPEPTSLLLGAIGLSTVFGARLKLRRK